MTTSNLKGDRGDILQVSLTLLRAVNGSDVAGVRDVWAVDGILMPPHHPVVSGIDAITQYFTDLFQRAHFTFEFTNSRIEVEGNLAVEYVQYTSTRFPPGGGAPSSDAGKGLHVFRRQSNGGWQLCMDIWNTDHPRPLHFG